MKNIVSISYHDLISKKNIDPIIMQAFGNKGLGAMYVTNIPKFKKTKDNLLYLSKIFAELPPYIQKKYEHPQSNYAFGWSKSKEKMKSGVPDLSKGSYYANPIYDKLTNDEELMKKLPSFFNMNIWPKEIPEYEKNFKTLGKIMYNIGLNVLTSCDSYLEKKLKNYKKDYLHNMIKNSKTYKARLLHYYPLKAELNKFEDSACGLHLDHGCLTVLTRALYLNSNNEEIQRPNDGCGLHIKDKENNNIRVTIPENSVLIQIGEILQVLSGGYFQATPHFVTSSKEQNITRETFALFMDCSPYQVLKLPQDSLKNVLETKNIEKIKGIPLLKNRIKGCKYYHEFVKNTLSAYYS